VQFIDLNSQQERIKDNIENNIKKVLAHGKYINGPEVKELEEKLAEYVGVNYAVGVGSGTEALLISLMAYDVKPKDAIFTTTFTFIATAEVVQLLKATPVFVDIDPKTFNIDVNKLEEEIKKVINEYKLNPKGIIAVDIFGQPSDYDKINAIAKKYNLFVLEDAAQSFGASYKGRKACSVADVAATSFFPAKPLGCYGDGGMIFTNNEDLYLAMSSIRVHGKGNNKYDNIRLGINGRLDTLQAAILLSKIEIFDEEIMLRQEVAERYSTAFKGSYEIQFIKEKNTSVWAQFSVLHSKRETVIDKLNNKGIPSAIYYPKPLHLQKIFSYLGYCDGRFPVAERVSREIFSIPMYPYLKKEDQDKIIDTLIT
jgi:UDP-2-acetamido-2-deoxy-ribo-hexuluronate aminotransferase